MGNEKFEENDQESVNYANEFVFNQNANQISIVELRSKLK